MWCITNTEFYYFKVIYKVKDKHCVWNIYATCILLIQKSSVLATIKIILWFVFNEFTIVMIKFCKVKLVMKIFRLVRQTSVACVSIYLVIFNVLCPLHEIYSSRVILSFPVITSKIVQTIHCTTLRNHICLKALYNKNLIISNHF